MSQAQVRSTIQRFGSALIGLVEARDHLDADVVVPAVLDDVRLTRVAQSLASERSGRGHDRPQ